jgi:hypothetical protein
MWGELKTRRLFGSFYLQASARHHHPFVVPKYKQTMPWVLLRKEVQLLFQVPTVQNGVQATQQQA